MEEKEEEKRKNDRVRRVRCDNNGGEGEKREGRGEAIKEEQKERRWSG